MSQIEEINNFTKSLASKAIYGLRGEKPIAIISTLAYLSEHNLEGVQLLDLLGSPQHHSGIKNTFMRLTSRYGKIRDPSTSWSVITGKNREIQRTIENNGKVNKAFSGLTREQVNCLYKYWIEQLEIAKKNDNSNSIVRLEEPKFSKPISESTYDSSHQPYVVTLRQGIPSRVEVWTERRLPFEPSGWLKELRTDIYNAVNNLSALHNEILHGVYSSAISEKVDVENVLFYNVGSDCFSKSTRRGLMFERSFSEQAKPSSESRSYPRYHLYEMVPLTNDFMYSSKDTNIVRWDSINCASLTNASSVWHDMAKGTKHLMQNPGHDMQRFGLSITIKGPSFTKSAQSFVKPIFDGVVASFHRHDGSNAAMISERLSTMLDDSTSNIESLLNDGIFNVLGTRRLVWPWRDGVQWNPSDEYCLAGRLLLNKEESIHGYMIEGELFEIKEKH